MKKYFFLILLCTYQFLLSQETITLTYIGNMGVLVDDGSQSVLFDGLHTKYGDDYLFPSETLIEKVTTGTDGYIIPKVLLFTHMHGDHFHGKITADFLTQNPESKVLGPSQVTSTMKGHDSNKVTVATSNYKKKGFRVNDIFIKAFKIDHGGRKHVNTQNVGYIVALANKKVLHVGDTAWFENIQLFKRLKLKEEQIDIAILPYWMMLRGDAEAALKRNLAPKKLVLTHISPKATSEELRELQDRFPEAILLTEQEKKIKIN